MGYTLSVAIPNYNNSKFLPKCVESIVAQSYDNLIEILIVDDCSTDNSREVILALADQYPIVKPVLLEKNGRVSAARNAGLMAAMGEYITFVDADDYYYNPDKLKNEMELIRKYREMGKDVVSYSSIVQVSNDGTKISFPTFAQSKYPQGNIYNRLVIDMYSMMVMRDYCIKTEILRDIGGYDVNHSLFEDYELNLKIAQRIHFYYTGEYGTAYRNSVGGLSKKPCKVLVQTKNEIVKSQIKTNPLPKRISLTIKRGIVQTLKKVYNIIRRKEV